MSQPQPGLPVLGPGAGREHLYQQPRLLQEPPLHPDSHRHGDGRLAGRGLGARREQWGRREQRLRHLGRLQRNGLHAQLNSAPAKCARWMNSATFCLELSALSRPVFRFAAPLLSALCLLALPAMPASPRAHVATSPVASGGWLTRFNTWRANTGLPLLAENTTGGTGEYDDALHMVKNDLVTHYDTPGTPYYTTDGDTAARNSNIYVSSSTTTADSTAIDWWMQAPFHAMGMMDPRLTQPGFGSHREVKSGRNIGAAGGVLRGNPFSRDPNPVYFPGNGATEPLMSYGGNEFPDPLQGCPGYSAPTELPVFIQVARNVTTVPSPTL